MGRPRVYIGCSLNGAPNTFIKDVAKLKSLLSDNYDILEFIGLEYKSVAQVYKWDIEYCVRTCDLFVAICDERSTGLGWELCEAIHLGTPVLAVAKMKAKVSGVVLGAAELKSTMVFKRYNSLLNELPKLIKKEVDKLPSKI